MRINQATFVGIYGLVLCARLAHPHNTRLSVCLLILPILASRLIILFKTYSRAIVALCCLGLVCWLLDSWLKAYSLTPCRIFFFY